MARDVMILMGVNSFRGPLEGMALKIETFLGPEMATSKASAGSRGQKSLRMCSRVSFVPAIIFVHIQSICTVPVLCG